MNDQTYRRQIIQNLCYDNEKAMEPVADGPKEANVRQRLYRSISASEYRVIHLLPGNFDDKIQCILETRSTKVKCRYEALSYQWGDEKNKTTIEIAPLDSSSQQETHQLKRILPQSHVVNLRKILTSSQAIVLRYIIPLRVIIAIVFSVAITYLFTPSVIGPPDWVPSFVPDSVYIKFLCVLFGISVQQFMKKAAALVVEVMETKPWLLVHDVNKNRYRTLLGPSPKFETLSVTKNLGLALRYLRQEKSGRMLWIDALCINQKDAVEKTAEVQRMDWIYANASPIVVWLGGYHNATPEDACPIATLQADEICEHRRQIQLAFDHVGSLSGWRLLFEWSTHRSETTRFDEFRKGFLEIASRGWWGRLWVVQEAALATGMVQIQLGYNTCEFEKFGSAQYSLARTYGKDHTLQDTIRPCGHMLATIRDFRYCSFHDRGNPIAKLMSKFLMRTVGVVFKDADEGVAQFQEQPFHEKLSRTLMRTAGHFECRDDRDRLYAVLGIAGGGATGDRTKLSNFMDTLNSHSTQMIIAQQMDFLWKKGAFSWNVKAACLVFAVACSTWAAFYDSTAKHWTINRPDYVVAGYRQVVDAATGGSEQETNRAKFFTSLAIYLAEETKSLAFLEAANCGEDKDKQMPSWVPNWSKEVSKEAYDFVCRTKKNQATDIFQVCEDEKSIQIVGEPRGRVFSLRSMTLGTSQASPWSNTLRKLLALPSEGRHLLLFAMGTMVRKLRQRPYSSLTVQEKALMASCLMSVDSCILLGAQLLEEEGTTSVYYYDGVDRRVGCLTAGQAAEGDIIVSVPGCFSHLVLRRKESIMGIRPRWALVGRLIDPSENEREKGYSTSQWAKLLKDKTLCRYAIE